MDFCLWMLLPTRTNVAFHFSGIKRKPLELYWNQTLYLLESVWLPFYLWGRGGAGRNAWALGRQPLPGSAVGPVAASAGFKGPGLVTGLIPPCSDLQVASLVSQRGGARPAVPLPWRCSAQPVCTELALGLCPSSFQKIGQSVGKLWSGWEDSTFSLRKPDQGQCAEGPSRNPGARAAQLWGTREAAKLGKAEKNDTEKGCFPFEIARLPPTSYRVKEGEQESTQRPGFCFLQ